MVFKAQKKRRKSGENDYTKGQVVAKCNSNDKKDNKEKFFEIKDFCIFYKIILDEFFLCFYT